MVTRVFMEPVRLEGSIRAAQSKIVRSVIGVALCSSGGFVIKPRMQDDLPMRMQSSHL